VLIPETAMPEAQLEIAPLSTRELVAASRSPAELLARAAAAACLSGLALATVILLARRAAGMLVEPLGPTPLAVAGLLIALLALLAQWPRWTSSAARHDRRVRVADVLSLGAPLTLAILLAAAVTLPGTPLFAAVLLWLPLAIGQSAIAWLYRRRFAARHGMPRDENARPHESNADESNAAEHTLHSALPTICDDAKPRANSIADEDSDTDTDAPLPHDVTQRWTRRSVDGVDVLEGTARAAFRAGERVANLHVGVCPPFAAPPDVIAETIAEADDGVDAAIKVAEALPFGLRLEVRLARQAEAATSVLVAVVARCATDHGSESTQHAER
jgi:hypothetical protein